MNFADALYVSQPAPRAENASAPKAPGVEAKGAPGEFAAKLHEATAAAEPAPVDEPASDVTAEAAPVVAEQPDAPQAQKPKTSVLAFLTALQGVEPVATTEGDAAEAPAAARLQAGAPAVVAPTPVVAAPTPVVAPVVAIAPTAPAVTPEAQPAETVAAPVIDPASPAPAAATEQPAALVAEAPPSLDTLKAALAAAGGAETPTQQTTVTTAAQPQAVAAAVTPVIAPVKEAAPVTADAGPGVAGAEADAQADVDQTAAPASQTVKPAAAQTAQAQPTTGKNAQAAKIAAAADPAVQTAELKASAPATQSVDASPAASTTATSSSSATPSSSTPAVLREAPAAAVQVFTRFVERFDGRAQRFEVRLDPAELGRVDVRIEVGADKKVHAVLAAHDSAALSDLMRGQRHLERALADAGVDLADNGLSFELSSDARGSADNGGRSNTQAADELIHAWRPFEQVTVPVEAEPALAAQSRPWRNARLNLVA